MEVWPFRPKWPLFRRFSANPALFRQEAVRLRHPVVFGPVSWSRRFLLDVAGVTGGRVIAFFGDAKLPHRPKWPLFRRFSANPALFRQEAVRLKYLVVFGPVSWSRRFLLDVAGVTGDRVIAFLVTPNCLIDRAVWSFLGGFSYRRRQESGSCPVRLIWPDGPTRYLHFGSSVAAVVRQGPELEPRPRPAKCLEKWPSSHLSS